MATSDDASPPTAPAEEPATSGGLGLDDIREMLLALVPEAGEPVRWHDVTGAEYEAPPYASARAQIRLLEILRNALPRVRDSVLSFRALRAEGAGQATGLAGLSSLMDLLSDPESLAVLERMFVVLHPVAVHRAAKNLNLPTGADVGAGDVFSAEEMLRAVLPFSIRPVLSLMDQLAPAGVRLMRVAR